MNKIKRCAFCQARFMQTAANKIYCSQQCQIEHLRRQENERRERERQDKVAERKRQRAKFAKIQTEIIKYNKDHGTNLSYGQYVAMKEMGANYGRS